MQSADLEFGSVPVVCLQELGVSSEPQRLHGLLSPWKHVGDPHTTRRHPLELLRWDLCAAEAGWRHSKLEREDGKALKRVVELLGATTNFGCLLALKRDLERGRSLRCSPSSTTSTCGVSSGPATGLRSEGSRTTPAMCWWPLLG